MNSYLKITLPVHHSFSEAGNGRVYDPKLARFLNPDPVIANPTFTQDYNAYSYVRNNPLGYVDPSGYIAYDVMMPRYFGGVPGSGKDGRLFGGGSSYYSNFGTPNGPLEFDRDFLKSYDWEHKTYTTLNGKTIPAEGVTADMILNGFTELNYTTHSKIVTVLQTEVGLAMLKSVTKRKGKVVNKWIPLYYPVDIVITWYYFKEDEFLEDDAMINVYNEGSDYIAGTGLFLDMAGGAASLAARDLKYAKYAVRGQDLLRQAKVLSKASVSASALGGAIGVVDNTIQAIDDFSNGNNVSGALQTTQAGMYATGLVFLAIPGGQIIGGGLILAAGVSDLVEYFTNQK